jgi:hypothetical protein
VTVGGPARKTLDEDFLIGAIAVALIGSARVDGNTAREHHTQLRRRSTQQCVWRPPATICERRDHENTVVLKIDLSDVDRAAGTVVSAIDALGERRLERRDDTVAARGIDADRAIHERFLGLSRWRA